MENFGGMKDRDLHICIPLEKSLIHVYKRRVLTDVLPQVSGMLEQKGRFSMNFKRNC